MTAIEKYMEYMKNEVVSAYCPFSFPGIAQGITETHPDPEICEGGSCECCWNMEWREDYDRR